MATKKTAAKKATTTKKTASKVATKAAPKVAEKPAAPAPAETAKKATTTPPIAPAMSPPFEGKITTFPAGTGEKPKEWGNAGKIEITPAELQRLVSDAVKSVTGGERDPIRTPENRVGFDATFTLFRGKHLFCGDDHIGWFVPGTARAVLRPEFDGFQDWLKNRFAQNQGRPLSRIEIGSSRPLFTIEDKTETGKGCPQHILRNADPSKGDLDPAVVKWHRENLSAADFRERYADRLGMDFGKAPAPAAQPVKEVELNTADIAAAQGYRDPGENGPDTEIDPAAGAVPINKLDDGSGEADAYDVDDTDEADLGPGTTGEEENEIDASAGDHKDDEIPDDTDPEDFLKD